MKMKRCLIWLRPQLQWRRLLVRQCVCCAQISFKIAILVPSPSDTLGASQSPGWPESLEKLPANITSNETSFPFSMEHESDADLGAAFLLGRESRIYSFDSTTIPQDPSFTLGISPGHLSDVQSVTHDSSPSAGIASFSFPELSGSNLSPQTTITTTPNSTYAGHGKLVQSLYPASLPPQYLVEHLVDLFFTSVPYGNRILHRPTFLASLREVPGTRKYPSATILHAICACTSFFSHLVDRPNMPDLSVRAPYEVWVPSQILEEEHSLASGSRVNFALEQAVLARAMIEMDIRMGRQVIMAVTALMALCWYYVRTSVWYKSTTTISTNLWRAIACKRSVRIDLPSVPSNVLIIP